MAEALDLLSRDPERCAQLSNKAKLKVSSAFGLTVMLAAYQKLYTKLL